MDLTYFSSEGWQRQTNLYPYPHPHHTPPAEFVYQTTYTFIFKCHNGNIYDQYLVEGSSLSAAQLYLEQHSVQSEMRLYVLSSRESYNTLVKA